MDVFLSARDVAGALGCSRAKVYTLRERGEFPEGKLFGGSRVWNRIEVEAYLRKLGLTDEQVAEKMPVKSARGTRMPKVSA